MDGRSSIPPSGENYFQKPVKPELLSTSSRITTPASAEPTDSKSPLPATATPTASRIDSKLQPQPFMNSGAYERASALGCALAPAAGTAVELSPGDSGVGSLAGAEGSFMMV